MTVIERPIRGALIRRRAAVAAAAALAPVLVWTIAVPVLQLHVTVPEGPGSSVRHALELPAVAGAAVLAVLAGWALLALLESVTARAWTIWRTVALAVAVLTLPYLPGFSVVERIVITLLHVSLAAVLVLGMRRTRR